MKLTINENINLALFLKKLFNIIGTENIINSPKMLENLVEIWNDKGGNPIAFKIASKRINLQEPWNETSKYYVDCQEIISYDHKLKINKHDKFSFNFEIAEKYETELKKFRIDYKPSKTPSLHAHDYNYEYNKKHLEYPVDVKLLLPAIDVITTLLILNVYINCTDQYPLDSKYSNKYNGIIKKARIEYDDHFRNNLF